MNRFDEKMICILRELKEKYHAVGIKAEFENEGTTLEEAMRLTNIATMSDIPVVGTKALLLSLIPFCANDTAGKDNNSTPKKIEFVFISLKFNFWICNF